MANNANKVQGSGFLLTRQAQDKWGGIVITLWLKSAIGAIKLEVSDQLAVFFVENAHLPSSIKALESVNIPFEKTTELSLKTFKQQQVSGIYFKTMKDFYAARDVLKQHGIICYEDDIRPDDRFLMERFITADVDYLGDAKNSNNPYHHITQVKCKAPKSKSNGVSLSMASIDIECAMDGTLYSFGLYADETRCVFMIGEEETPSNNVDVNIEWLADEKQLLRRIVQWFSEFDPDIIIGWNVVNFDFELLQKRCDKHGIIFAIGRDKTPAHWRRNRANEQVFIEVAGRVILDGIDLLKTATYSFPSYSLDNVANTLLGIGKKVDDVDNRLEEITYNFHHNKQALAAYNLEDCRLVWLIFEETNLLEFATLRAQLTGLAIDRIGGSVAAFTNLYLPKLHRSGYVAPNMGDGESDLVSPGGYVMDSVPGLYENVLVLDFKSLYPSIIRTFNIDPMGLIEGLIDHQLNRNDPIIGFDGAYFSRTQHFLPDILVSLWRERDIAKRDNNVALSQAIKIIMNSFYGILGSTGCRFFDPRLSGSITKRSHQLLKQTKSWIEALGYQVIYGDTDSIFVHVKGDKSAQDCKQLGKELQVDINQRMNKQLRQDYKVDSALEIEFETHFSQFFMPMVRGQASANIQSSIGTKKRYAGIVSQKASSSLIFKGMETVRSDWTALSKSFQQNLYQRIFDKAPVEQYIKDIVANTEAGLFDEQLVFRKRIRRRLDEYVKNVPPHVKAARLADEHNNKLGKPLKYQKKGWIEYFITLDGPQPKEYLSSPLDYDFYVERQLKSIADDILPFIGTSFSQIVDKQMGLF